MSHPTYDAKDFQGLTFSTSIAAFRDGTDNPRDYLERCIEVIEARDEQVRAFVCLNTENAREAADASASRWKDGKPLSSIDGMPVAIKDLLETRDMPTEFGCEAARGNFPKRDNAAVAALRAAGAVVFGKTVTAELGGTHPGPTTNPFDPERTPGGSSSGSAAAVAAGMVPAAIGSQVGGSIIRPAGFCGNVALKPSQGGINRGERMATSMSTHGVHANSIDDMWRVAIEIVARAGGDRGSPGILGPMTTPAARRPERLMVLEGDGWSALDDATRAAFEAMLKAMAKAGVRIVRRSASAHLEHLEQAVAGAGAICDGITAWENRWSVRALVDQDSEGVSVRARNSLQRAENMTVEDYRLLLVRRAQAQVAHAALAGQADALISLSCPGPAPLWSGDTPGQPLARRPTGDAVFNYPSSMLFAPCVSMPLLAVGGLPVGMQFIGQREQDAWVTALARWAMETMTPITD